MIWEIFGTHVRQCVIAGYAHGPNIGMSQMIDATCAWRHGPHQRCCDVTSLALCHHTVQRGLLLFARRVTLRLVRLYQLFQSTHREPRPQLSYHVLQLRPHVWRHQHRWCVSGWFTATSRICVMISTLFWLCIALKVTKISKILFLHFIKAVVPSKLPLQIV